MKKLVFIPLDSTEDLIRTGIGMNHIENSYNPGGYFDEVYVISSKDEVNDYNTLKFIKADVSDISDLIKEIKPIAVRANAGYDCSDIALACRVKDIPIMISVHDSRMENISQSLIFADKVVCVSEEVKKVVSKYTSVDTRDLLMLPRFVDNSIFTRKFNTFFFTELNKKYGEGVHIIHVGRKSYEKNIETVIKSLVYLPKDYSLVQIGLGDSTKYEVIARSLNVLDRCFFVGGIPREELALYYSWADCMCTPSRREGFGLVFIEACACGCPVVTSNIGPMNEYLEDKKTALLVDDYENPYNIAKCILEICSNKVLAGEIRRNSKKVACRFDISNANSKEKENYIQLLSGFDEKKEKLFVKEFDKLNQKFAIYGRGKRGLEFFQDMKKYDKEPVCFIDKDISKIGSRIDGVKVIGIDDMVMVRNECIIVVSPLVHSDIVSYLREHGYNYIELDWYKALLANSNYIDGRFVSKNF